MPVDHIGSDINYEADGPSVESCHEVVSANEILGWDMFVAAMAPNQDLYTNIISNIYIHGQGFEGGKTLYSPFLLEGPR